MSNDLNLQLVSSGTYTIAADATGAGRVVLAAGTGGLPVDANGRCIVVSKCVTPLPALDAGLNFAKMSFVAGALTIVATTTTDRSTYAYYVYQL